MRQSTTLQHSIESFGILKVSMSGIRVEKIKVRVTPAVPFPHKHDFYQLMFITQGRGRHQIDFHSYPIKKGQLYIMKPGQVHSWNLAKDTDGFIIEFNRDSIQMESFGETDLLNHISFLPDILPFKSEDNREKILKTIEVMFDEFQEKKDLHDICLRNFLSALLIQVIRESSLYKRNQNRTLNNLECFRTLIEKHYRTEHRVEFYAKQLKVTPKALTMQVTRAFGKSPRALIQERFMMEAKRYLAFSSLSISEIGHELGFMDPNYFSRFFKIHENCSPGEFRNKLKSKK